MTRETVWTPISEILNGRKTNETVNIRGWIYRTRSSGNIIFIIVRDATGVLQCTITKDNVSDDEFNNAKKALIESSLELRGCLLYTSPSPRDLSTSRMPSSA